MAQTSPKTKAGAASQTAKATRARRRAKTKIRRPAPEATGSVVSADWRTRYKEHGGSCGDTLSVRLRKHLETDDGSVDATKLRALAEANGVWRDDYANLNVGLQRLAVGNRLRALERAGGKVKWGRR
jgi:hypothetical protein